MGTNSWTLSFEMKKDSVQVLQQVQNAWQQSVVQMKRMYGASVVRPADPNEIFVVKVDSNDEIKIEVNHVVFKVPEKANSRASDLYIVVCGWLSFQGPDFSIKPLKTKSYGTWIGYFRSKPGQLSHVYGAHYDMDEERPGHPVFHSQIGPQTAFGEIIKQQFHLTDAIVDEMGNLLRTVRTPSAQMDIFSVFMQVSADHLFGKDPSKDVKRAFGSMRTASDFYLGAGNHLAYLNQPPANTCYRSRHWYDAPAANQ